MIKGLHHISINCTDINASLHLYHDVLGWEITRIIPGKTLDAYYVHVPGSPGHAVPTGLCELELTDFHGNQIKKRYAENETCFHHIAIKVDDPAPLYEKLVNEGCIICMPLQKLDRYGHYTFGIVDPDGVKVEFIAPYPPVVPKEGE